MVTPPPHVPRCGHRGCTSELGTRLGTLPNAITLVRTAVTVAVCLLATVAVPAWPWLLAALATYWLGDIVDGLLARRTGNETRTGAVLDILADRLSVCLIVTIYSTTSADPRMLVPLGIFLVQFVVLDAYLSLAFLRWPLLSPNYFHLVDARIHRWNWSPAAKSLNTGAVIVWWLLTHDPFGTTAAALLLLAVKIATACRLAYRTPTVPALAPGCAVEAARSPADAES